ncbi:MAG TPA: serine/threonine-protein kinase [Kofleriaceae bacterium]
MQANPGDILLGKYRVEDVIGIGGMGRVVRATHLYLHQSVAIKILLPTMAESSSTVERFLREAQSTVKLRNEHIARVMDVGTMPDGVPFMVMEFLEGFDLNQILRHHGPQLAQPVVDLILQACEGMSEAHALGIIHRDIKPSNFFITRRPDGSNLLKILDFGISKTPAGVSELTGTQTVVGTPTYMAPEQMRTARSTDPRSDIWSIGVVMYQMLVGRPPFEAETYAELVLKVGTDPPAPLYGIQLPAGLDTIVMRCLEKDPNNRVQNVGELARMLAPYASDPLSAQQSAERATRILTQPKDRMSLSQVSVGMGSGGMGLTPPPNATPHSWNKSSVGGAAGQMGASTAVVRGGRGMVIAGVAALCVAAGVGGFVIANSMSNKSPAVSTITPASQPVAAPAPTPAPAPAPAPVPAPAVPTVPTVPVAATGSADAGLKTPPTPTPTPKTVAKTTPKSTASRPAAKPASSAAKTKPAASDSLFDDRR